MLFDQNLKLKLRVFKLSHKPFRMAISLDECWGDDAERT